MLDFGVKPDSETLLDGGYNLIFEGYDFGGGGLSGEVHYDKGLFRIAGDVAYLLPFPSALLYHPGGRDFNHRGSASGLLHYVVGNCGFRAVFLAEVGEDAAVMLLRDYRILEEAAG